MKLERRVVLDAATSSSREARVFVTETLHEWDLERLAEDVRLMVSELVANTAMHTESATCELALSLTGPVLRVEACDASPPFSYRRRPDSAMLGGYGLEIVKRLSAAWGIEPRHAGKAVWFELMAPSRASVNDF